MKTRTGMTILTLAASLLLAGAALANEPEPVHRITDDNPAVGDEGKIMLYGVVLEKAVESHRVNNPHDTRQTLRQYESNLDDK